MEGGGSEGGVTERGGVRKAVCEGKIRVEWAIWPWGGGACKGGGSVTSVGAMWVMGLMGLMRLMRLMGLTGLMGLDGVGRPAKAGRSVIVKSFEKAGRGKGVRVFGVAGNRIVLPHGRIYSKVTPGVQGGAGGRDRG